MSSISNLLCVLLLGEMSYTTPFYISGNPEDDDETDKDLFNVDFDDSDTGKIPLDHIRIIPQDFPHVGKSRMSPLFTCVIFFCKSESFFY